MSRPALAMLSKNNLLHNLEVIKARVGKSKIIAMIKANAYGHGIRSVGLRLDGYVDLFGVASIDEALMLKKVQVKNEIILMQGVHEKGDLMLAANEGFHVVFNDQMQVNWLNENSFSLPLKSWLKVNTGMGRLGFDIIAAQSIYEELSNNKNTAKPIRIMSHFACADDEFHPLNQKQIATFGDFIGGTFTEYSLCNSAGIFNFQNCHLDYVRPGIALYGVSPIKDKIASHFGLKPVMTVRSQLISVSMAKKSSFIGYGARYQCHEDMPVGIVAFGYGDGYPLSAEDGTPVLVNETICPLIGRVSMDMLALDLRSYPSAKVGDCVTLWGDGLPIENVIKTSASSVWNTLASVQNRVRFVWVD